MVGDNRDTRMMMGTIKALVDRDLAEINIYKETDGYKHVLQLLPMGRRLLGFEAPPEAAARPLEVGAIHSPEEMRRRITERDGAMVAELTERIMRAIDLEWDMGPEPVLVHLGRKEVPKRVERMLKDQFAAKDWALDYGTAAAESGGGTERTVTATSIVGSQR